MDLLHAKFENFKELNNYVFKYFLDDGNTLSFRMTQYCFPHLVGLQKLTDIPVIVSFNDQSQPKISAKYINGLIKKEVILTDESLRKSAHFSEIEDRYNFLTKENLLSVCFNEVIIDFNPSLAYSKLKSAFLLVENKNGGYIHLGLKRTNNEFVPETFFFRNDDFYIRNQIKIAVKRIEIYDGKKQLILEQDL